MENLYYRAIASLPHLTNQDAHDQNVVLLFPANKLTVTEALKQKLILVGSFGGWCWVTGVVFLCTTYWAKKVDFMCALLKGVSLVVRKNMRGILVIAMMSVFIVTLLMGLLYTIKASYFPEFPRQDKNLNS